jgi:hypothetical protein
MRHVARLEDAMTTRDEPTCTQTPDGTYVFETLGPDGRRLVAVVLPEDVDEIAGPLSANPPEADERRRRFQVARLLADQELREQADGRVRDDQLPPSDGAG